MLLAVQHAEGEEREGGKRGVICWEAVEGGVGIPNSPNQPPTVTASGPTDVLFPPGTASLTGSVRDDALPVSGTLAYAWTKFSGPGDVSFSRPAQAATAATFSAEGTYVLQLEATDGELTGFARVTVTVAATNSGPTVSAGPNQVLTYPTRTAALAGTTSDDGRPVDGTMTTRWSVISGAGPVSFSAPSALATQVDFAYPGTYVLRLTASDGQMSTSSDLTIVVGATPGVAPTVAISSPADGAKLTAPTDVNGTVSGGEWKLEHALGGEDGTPSWVTFAIGTGAVSNAKLGRLDPTMMLNGIYAIRLTSTTSEGTANAVIDISIEKNLKVGNFTVSFSDLSVPVSGLPIEVIRTYDSRDKTVGDFGVGWNVSLRNIRVETSGVLGKAWRQVKQPGFWPTYCLTQARPRFVTVTFPTGKVQRFKAVTAPDCEMFTQIALAELGFEAEPGTHGKLTATAGAALIPTENTLLDSDGRVFDPSSFQFTSDDGTVYEVEKKKGLRWMQDRNGNTVSVSPAGVIHSAGKGITFDRDSTGRIRKMTDPSGAALTYEYDVDGNLQAVVDREHNRTRFEYNDDHGLAEIYDPRGVRAIRNEYDPVDGRLVRNIDADGKAIEYTHDLAGNTETITDRTGAPRVLSYDNAGNVVAELDAENGLITRTFDAEDNRTSETVEQTVTLSHTSSWEYQAGNVTEQTNALQKTTFYTYNAWNQVLTTKDPLDHTTTNTYDPRNGNLLSTKDALQHATTFTYYPDGNLATRTDRLNRPTSYGYDSFGNLTSETDALGNVTSYTYDSNGNRLTETRKRTKADGTQETLVARFTYNKSGRLLSTMQPDGSVTSTTYNEAGLRDTSTDAAGRVTHYTYDDQGRLTHTLYPDDTSTSATYDEEGRRKTSTDRGGRVTTMEYDGVGRLKKTIYQDQPSTSTEYYLNGWVKSSTDAGGHTTRYEYDAAGRQSVVWDAKAKPTRFSYDDAGNQLTVTDALNHTTTSFYDASNRMWKTELHDSTYRTTTYDPEGQRISETDQANKTTRFGYDPLGRLATVTDALEHVTGYGYDEIGNRITVIDAANKTTSFVYDSLGRETKRILPDLKYERKSYYADGALWTRTDFQDRTTVFAYDESGRLASKTYPDLSTVSFTYTPNGRRETATDARGITRYGYDNRDRLRWMEYPDGKRIEYGYDEEGRRTTLTAKVGTTTLVTTYGYDVLDRIANVTDPDSRVFGMEYDDVGSLAKLVRPNGVDTAFTHDGLGRLRNIRTYAKATDATIASYAYTLGATGIRTRIDESDGTARAYEYDDLYRLTKETVTGAQPYEKSFAYDAVSNRTVQTSTGDVGGSQLDAAVSSVDAAAGGTGATNYSYDNRDRLMSEGGTAYAWSENGNLVGKAGEATYEWDFEDRLVKVTKADGAVVENVYDVDGVLVRTTTNGVATDLLVDTSGGLSHVVAEIDSSGAVTALYVRAGDMLLEEIRGDVAKMYEADGLGSIRGLLDGSGARTDSYSYEAFGSTLSSTGNDENPYRFAGERFVDSVGFYQNRARWLDTRTGRFASVDPVRGNHPYSYTDQQPTTLTDASGECAGCSLVGLTMAVTMYFALENSVNAADAGVLTARKAGISTSCRTCKEKGSVRFGVSAAEPGEIANYYNAGMQLAATTAQKPRCVSFFKDRVRGSKLSDLLADKGISVHIVPYAVGEQSGAFNHPDDDSSAKGWIRTIYINCDRLADRQRVPAGQEVQFVGQKLVHEMAHLGAYRWLYDSWKQNPGEPDEVGDVAEMQCFGSRY